MGGGQVPQRNRVLARQCEAVLHCPAQGVHVALHKQPLLLHGLQHASTAVISTCRAKHYKSGAVC